MNIDDIHQRFQRAKSRRMNWESMWEDCIAYTMPGRQSFYIDNPGSERTELVFDETAIVAVGEFVSRMQSAIIPPGRQWFRIETSDQVPAASRKEVQAKLDEASAFLYRKIMASNFDVEAPELLMDLAIGTGAMSVDVDEIGTPVFRSAALPNVWVEEGINGKVGGVFRKRKLRTEQVNAEYNPMPKLDEKEQNPKVVIEATVRDYGNIGTETWSYVRYIEDTKQILSEEEYTGGGSCPWVVPRWLKSADEWYGRGPLIGLLPAIRSVNLMRELIFENAELAIGGIWQYPNDGSVNVDQIQIAPNTFIPKAPGSEGLTPLQSPSRFDVAEANLQDLRYTIKRGLFTEDFTPTGKTPLSALEISARQADLAQRIGSPFARIIHELVSPIIVRLVYLYKERGELDIPRIDGDFIKISPVSPLARAQKAEDIQRMTGFIGTLVNMLGPEVTGTYIKDEQTVEEMAFLFEFPAGLLHDNKSRVEAAKRNKQLSDQMSETLKVAPAQETRQVIEKGGIQGPM